MSRTVVGYVPGGYLNSAASSSEFGSTDAESGLPIATGLTLGAFQEFSDAEAKLYSSPTGNTLYSGTYQWVKLDPAVTGTVPIGSALFWLQTASGIVVTTVASGNSPDYAGVSIDPNFGAALPYAFMQVNGKVVVQLVAAGTAAVYGSPIQLSTTASTFLALAAATTQTDGLFVGYALAVIASGAAGLARIIRPVARF